ncbi:hypothetical protein I8751_22055 [Nostocaceae cyanobacterium CENA357]|uniref:Uncharacterized protein n=1 Tax=Atlanticothrix silvestris CENA357 TaxID=1725252 RepID=A0A8J7L4N1_9CYAN|nr:hypothetical protein [Atlanticothrix silvestris]MBH8554981.1 hypothetical protein [Atlanticothrix silvestris CENA357]
MPHSTIFQKSIWMDAEPYSPTGNRRIISTNSIASPSGVETTPPDIASTIRCCRAHSNHALTSAVTVLLPFAPLLQELMNSPVGLSHQHKSDRTGYICPMLINHPQTWLLVNQQQL